MYVTDRYDELVSEFSQHAGPILIAEQVWRIAEAVRPVGEPSDSPDAPNFYSAEPGGSVSYGDDDPAEPDVVCRYRELLSEYGHRAAEVLLGEAFAEMAAAFEAKAAAAFTRPVAGLMYTLTPKDDPDRPGMTTASTSNVDTKVEKLFKKHMK